MLCLVLCLCGCNSFTTKSNITNLLSAPKLSENESNIVAAIESYLGEDVTLKYSQSQGYSAPVQLIDINYDSINEAAVFYYAPNQGANIRFALLSYADENWNIVMDKEGLGTEVFYFDTIVLPNVSGKQITVGYQSANIEENFFVTYFTDTEKAVDDYIESCEYIVDGDMTDSRYSDIILTKLANNGNVSINLLNFTEDMTFKNISSRNLKYSDIEISQLAVKRLADGKNALFIDYSDGYNRMHTEVYTVNKGRLESCISNGIVSKSWEYEPVITSRDIDGDGYMEIATVIQPTHPEEVPAFKYMEWSDWTQNEVKRKYYGVFDTRENIFVALPDEWQDAVYARVMENGFEIVQTETEAVMLNLTEIESISQVDSSAYSYGVYLGTKLWQLDCSEDMSMSQVEYVYKSITDFD